MGLSDKLKTDLKKTADLLRTDIRDLFKSEGHLVDEKFLDGLLQLLFRCDMGVQAAQEIVEKVRMTYRGRVARMEDVLGSIKQKLKELLSQPGEP